MAVQTTTYIKSRFTTGSLPTEQDFADLVDTVIAVAQTKTITYVIKDHPTGTQKPSGNTLTDTLLVNVNILDTMIRNNVALQWAAAGVTFTAGTGIINFTAIGGLQDGDILTVSYY